MEKKTPLYDEHVHAGARIVSFAGFLMPLQYSGIVDEHRAVRTAVGMFDLSHMGEFRVSGPAAVDAVDRLVTNDISGLADFQVRYTPMCYADGGIVDDLLVYRFQNDLMLVVNAANIEKDLAWIREHLPTGVQAVDRSEETALIALQGPRAQEILQMLTNQGVDDVEYYSFREGPVAGFPAVISRTGYTGEDGFELYVQSDVAESLWQALQERGESFGLKPVGLGARDTLRLEAGYMLYGSDIDDTTSPLEAGLGWTVKFAGADFVGRQVLERQKREGLKRRMVAFEMEDRGIPRSHCTIWNDGRQIGEVTSGTYSPTFERGIGLGYVDASCAKVGGEVQVDIRQRRHVARVARKPLYKRKEK